MPMELFLLPKKVQNSESGVLTVVVITLLDFVIINNTSGNNSGDSNISGGSGGGNSGGNYNNYSGVNRSVRNITCFKYGEEGHISRFCILGNANGNLHAPVNFPRQC